MAPLSASLEYRAAQWRRLWDALLADEPNPPTNPESTDDENSDDRQEAAF
ncbi:MAG: hypothetical protein ACJ789_12975 [Thermomicrobiales bacterium]